MATRANIVIRSTGRTYWLYHHWDGYPSYLGAKLGDFLMGNKDDIDSIATQLIKGVALEDDGFELTNFRHLDIEWLYEINVAENKLYVFRTTPFNREIADLLIAVNRQYNKSDYIPCITWGRNARYCKNLPVGEQVLVVGRIQSRQYQKKLDDEQTVTMTAYEVSVSKVTQVDQSVTQLQTESLALQPLV